MAAAKPAAAAAPAAAPASTGATVDQVCAGSGNFLARDFCRMRECGKPSFASDPVCVRFRQMDEARRQAAEVMAALPDPYVDMDPALAEALQQRQAELASLRATNIGLLFKAVDG